MIIANNSSDTNNINDSNGSIYAGNESIMVI